MRLPCAVLILAALVVASAGAAELTAVVRKSEVNVYAQPNLEAAKLEKLKQDTTVAIAYTDNLMTRTQALSKQH